MGSLRHALHQALVDTSVHQGVPVFSYPTPQFLRHPEEIGVNIGIRRAEDTNSHDDSLFFPETTGDILKLPVLRLAVETLVGSGLLEWSQMLDERTDLDIIEIGLTNRGRDADAPTIPCDLEHRMRLMNILRQLVDTFRIGVTSHEGDTSDVATDLFDKAIKGIGIQGEPDVLPEILAVAARTASGAIRDVDCQSHLIGYLLEYDASVDVFQHVCCQ